MVPVGLETTDTGSLHDARPDPKDFYLRGRCVHGGQRYREVGQVKEQARHVLVHDVDPTVGTDRKCPRFFGLYR